MVIYINIFSKSLNKSWYSWQQCCIFFSNVPLCLVEDTYCS